MNFRRLKRWAGRLGKRGERAAARLFEDKGCSVLMRDCRTRGGELDIVARDGVTLVFAEVKTRFHRPGRKTPRPFLNLGDAQKKRIWRGAHDYLRELGDPALAFRFDLVEVVANRFGIESIRHHLNAFGQEELFAPHRYHLFSPEV